MKIVYDPRHVFYNPKSEIDGTKTVANPETPLRVEEIIKVLKMKYENSFIPVKDFPRSYIYLAHEQEYVIWLKYKSKEIPDGEEYFPKVFGYDRIFDNGTPILNNSFEMAWMAVKCALTGAQTILENQDELVYVGSRPPGHHAGKNLGGGYCYLNNIAIAAKYLQMKTGGTVAILDLDYHHGNGTQEIFYQDNSVLFTSIHGNPNQTFPFTSGFEWEIGEGEGKGYNINFPLNEGIDGRIYLRVFEKALKEIEDYSPDYLLVSLGTDTHKDDPLGKFKLIGSDYFEMGRMLNAIEIPKLIIQEGGYNPLGNAEAVDNFITGLIV